MKKILISLLITGMFFSCAKDEGSEPKQTPKEIRVDGITIKKFPSDDGGSSWDIGSGADLTFTLTKNGGGFSFEYDKFIENADPTKDYLFVPVNLFIKDINARHTFSLYDYDSGSSDDYMGGIEFTPFTAAAPNKILLSCNGCTIEAELQVTYFY